MAKSAYVDAPFPSQFKEKLFVYLSRYCGSCYCFCRHAGFLAGYGNAAGDAECVPLSADEICDLLETPLPTAQQLGPLCDSLSRCRLSASVWEVDQEPILLVLAAVSFRRQHGSELAERALCDYLGRPKFDRLISFLAFIKTAHFWTETHGQLRPESDVIAWLQSEPQLAAWVQTNFRDHPAALRERIPPNEPPKEVAWPIPQGEAGRLAALQSSGLLDSPPEIEFDDVAGLAATVCDTPISLVSLVDRQRQWFKARVGLDCDETPRDVSFCAHAICRPEEMMVISDATQDQRFAENPLVTGEPGIRFYAGVPLVDRFGQALGTLCVIDTRVRQLSNVQQTTLMALARQCAKLMEAHQLNALLRTEAAQRRELERHMRGHAEAMRKLLDRVNKIILVVDGSGTMQYSNLEWTATTGHPSGMANPVHDIFCNPSWAEILDQLGRGPDATIRTFEVVDAGGHCMRLHGTAAVQASLDGEVVTVSFMLSRNKSDVQRSGFVTVCAWCHCIRDSGSGWVKFDKYHSDATQMEISHGICESCAPRLLEDSNSED